MNIIEFFSKYNKFIIISALVLAIAAFIDKRLFSGIIFIAFLISLAMFLINKLKDKRQAKILSWIFLVSMLIHVLVVFFVFYTNFQPFSGGRGDFTEYNAFAQEISNRVHSGNFAINDLQLGHFYPVIVGYVYAFTTPSMLLGELLNAWLAALSAVFVYLIVKEIGGSEKEGIIIGLITNIYPSLIFFSSLLLKEPLVVLLCAIGLLLTIKIIKNFSFKIALILYAVFIGLTHFRIYISIALVLAFVICWFLFSEFKIKKKLVYGLIIILLIGLLPIISGGEAAGLGFFGTDFFKKFLNAESIIYYREVVYAPPVKDLTISEEQANKKIENSGNSSSIPIKVGLDNPYTFVKNSLLSFLAALLGPYPWQMKFGKQLFALPEVIAWYFALVFITIGAVKNFRQKHKVILPLILFAIFVLGVQALFINNYGIIVRIRMPAFLALLCLLPLGLKKINNIKIPFLNT